MMQRQNIPLELRERVQWIVSGADKIPRHAITKEVVDPTAPANWCNFQAACDSGYPNIGFCISPDDPYVFIDLDKPKDDVQRERHTRILASFQSYAEVSQSGNGVHIVVRGGLDGGRGRRADNVEVYSQDRYMITTGNVINNLPIAERQDLLTTLVNEMPEPTNNLVDLDRQPQTLSDEDVLKTAHEAENTDKFNMLWSGDWEGHYASQSEADMALLTILAFYSKCDEQVRRLFRFSALGQREKAYRDSYLNYGLGRIRSKQPPPIDMSAIASCESQVPVPGVHMGTEVGAPDEQLPLQGIPQVTTDVPEAPQPTTDIVLPPGLVGDVARYIYSSSQRPVVEIALCGALGLLAGVCGRSYNVSSTGLNLYLILLADTGRGKEAMASGINNLIAAVKTTVPAADQFMGPGAFASGQAIVRTVDKQPCLVSVLGEVGLTLQQICDPRANSAEKMFKRVLLDLYSKSGWTQALRPNVYSDAEKNTSIVQAPALTILGESTPAAFYESLTPQHIAEGLVPRFSIIEYNGPRQPRNPYAGHMPDEALTVGLSSLFATCVQMQMNSQCAAVTVDAGAQPILDDFDTYCDTKINAAQHDVEVQLWNRAHLKALKTAALVAVGQNANAPVITLESAQWAIEFVRKDVSTVLKRYVAGDIGNESARQSGALELAINDYLDSRHSDSYLQGYKVPKCLWGKPILPFSYLNRRARRIASFTNDRRGVKRALDEELNSLVDSGVLVELSWAERSELNVRQRLFVRAQG